MRTPRFSLTHWSALLSLSILAMAGSNAVLADTDLIKFESGLPMTDSGWIVLVNPIDKLVVGENYRVTAPTGELYSGVLTKIDERLSVIPFVDGKGSLELFLEEEGGGSVALFLTGSCTQYSAAIDAGGAGILQQVESSIICDDLGNISKALNHDASNQQSRLRFEQIGEPDVRSLESRPGSPYTILLDFWGGVVTGTHWNWSYQWGIPIFYDAYDFLDGNPASLTNTEVAYIYQAWMTASEDFAPFVVNVTTDVAVYNATPSNQRARNIITSKPAWYPNSSAGVGKVNGWGNAYTSTSWTWFNDTNAFLGGPDLEQRQDTLGTIASHEVGHTLGLQHHGNTSQADPEYYGGHGVWGPIMGAPYGRAYTQWSRGDYPGANRSSQNDIAIISSKLPLRPDDVGGTRASAELLMPNIFPYVREISPGGVRQDIDWFSFRVDEPRLLSLHVRPVSDDEGLSASSNLAMSGRLTFGSGLNLVVFDSADTSPLSPSTNTVFIDDQLLQPGTYYLQVRHDSPDTNPATGFRNYGNGGQYAINLGLTAFDPPTITAPFAGSTLTDDRVDIAWDANGTPIDAWRVLAGSTPGGAEWYDSGNLSASLDRKRVLNLPIDGQAVHLTLNYLPQGGGANNWQSLSINTTAASLRQPAIVSPRPGTAFESTTVRFRWQRNDFRNPKYRLLLGTSPGYSDIHTGNITNRDYATVDVSAISSAQTIYATLQYRHNTQGIGWHEVSSVYQNAGGSSVVDVDGPSDGSNPTYVWTTQEDAIRYQIEIRHLDPALPTHRQQFLPEAAGCYKDSGRFCSTRMKQFQIEGVVDVRLRVNRPGQGWGHWSLAYRYRP